MEPRPKLLRAIPEIKFVIEQTSANLFWRVLENRIDDKELGKKILRGASFDSSLISLRCLNEFFDGGKASNRIKARQFPNFDSPGPLLDKKEKDYIDDYCTHLTWNRTLKDEGWNTNLVFKALKHSLFFLYYLRDSFLEETELEKYEIVGLIDSIEQVLEKYAKDL